MNKIEILVVEPNKEPYVKKIRNTLKDKQTVVDGLIEIIELEDDVDLVCNEEGKIYNLEFNRNIENDIIAGTFFIVGQHQGEHISLSKKQIKKYKEQFKLCKDKTIIELSKISLKDSSKLLVLNVIGIENQELKGEFNNENIKKDKR